MRKYIIVIIYVFLFNSCVMEGFRNVKGADWLEENSNWVRADAKKTETEFGTGYLCQSSNMWNLMKELDGSDKIINIQIEDSNPNLDDIATALNGYSNVKVNLDLSKCIELSIIYGLGTANLLGIVLPENLMGIYDNAFKGSGIKNILIPQSMKRIGKKAFANCSRLTNITIPNNVTIIDEYAFSECSMLVSFDMSKSITSIMDYMFSGCKRLINIDIPDTVTSIGNGAFLGCDGLSSIDIPSSVKSIGSRAFSGCSELTNITIPNSVSSIGDYALSNCNKLTSITIPYYSNFKDIFNSDYLPSSIKKLIISDGVTSIGYSFWKSSIVNVEIPDTVTHIDMWAFYKCKELTSVSIGNGVTNIKEAVFSGCNNLSTLTIQATMPPSFDKDVFEDCTSLSSIYVPASSVAAYKSADGWSEYADYIYAIEE